MVRWNGFYVQQIKFIQKDRNLLSNRTSIKKSRQKYAILPFREHTTTAIYVHYIDKQRRHTHTHTRNVFSHDRVPIFPICLFYGNFTAALLYMQKGNFFCQKYFFQYRYGGRGGVQNCNICRNVCLCSSED